MKKNSYYSIYKNLHKFPCHLFVKRIILRTKPSQQFKSDDEIEFAKQMDIRELYYYYESFSFKLVHAFKGILKKYKDTIYTPDFVFAYAHRIYIVEIKGWKRNDEHMQKQNLVCK